MLERTTINCEPGRQVWHVWTAGPDGRPVECRWPYTVHGLAYDTRGCCWRVVLEDQSDTPQRGELLIFTLDTFSRSFVPRDLLSSAVPPAPAGEPAAPAGPPPERVAGKHTEGLGV